jgi:hypothetical protein
MAMKFVASSGFGPSAPIRPANSSGTWEPQSEPFGTVRNSSGLFTVEISTTVANGQNRRGGDGRLKTGG